VSNAFGATGPVSFARGGKFFPKPPLKNRFAWEGLHAPVLCAGFDNKVQWLILLADIDYKSSYFR
jgi:hypothetical protein